MPAWYGVPRKLENFTGLSMRRDVIPSLIGMVAQALGETPYRLLQAARALSVNGDRTTSPLSVDDGCHKWRAKTLDPRVVANRSCVPPLVTHQESK